MASCLALAVPTTHGPAERRASASALVAAVAEAHGGNARADNVAGSRVTVSLPFAGPPHARSA